MHVEALLPLVVLPHCRFLIAAEDVTAGHVEQVRQLVLAHRGLTPDWSTGEWLTDEAERIELEVSTRTFALPTVGDFARVLGYLVKPLDLVKPYLSAWPEAVLNERDYVPDLNENVVEFFHGYDVNCHSRHQLDYMGILDAKTGERCIAVPKPTCQQVAHKNRVAALLRECGDEATDELAFDRVAKSTRFCTRSANTLTYSCPLRTLSSSTPTQHPEVIVRLTKLLEKYVADGRSTPGAPQQNAVPVQIVKATKAAPAKAKQK